MGNRAKESELDKYADRAYRQLKEGIYRTSTKPSRGFFECPFCREKKGQDYLYDELMQHARRRGRGSRDVELKQQGQHVALAEYLVKYHGPKAPPATFDKGDLHGGSLKADATKRSVLHHAFGKEIQLASDTPKAPPVPSIEEMEIDSTLSRVLHTSEEEMKVGYESSSKSVGGKDTSGEQDKNKKFVFPWKGVLVNVPVELKNGRYVGESGTKMKAQLIEQGINVESVTPLWTREGHSRSCVVDFSGDWVGFGNAMKFDKAFDLDHHGKTDWNMVKSRGDKLYGWVATEEDYNSNSLIGKHLRPKSDLKSVHDVEAEKERKETKLVSQLNSTIKNKDLECKRMKSKLEATSASIHIMMDESDEMVQAHNEEMDKLHRKQREEIESMHVEHERMKKKIESQKKQLKLREKELEKREVRNERENRELSRQQRANEQAQEVQKQVDDTMLRLAEEQKKEKEALHEKIILLEKELDHKQALELEVERMRGAVNVMKHMGGDEDVDVNKKLELLEEELEGKEEELAYWDGIKQALIIKERNASEEMKEGLSALITGFQSGSTKGAKGARPTIGVKNIGELSGKPFENAAKSKYPAEVASEKATEWWSLWEARLRDPSWRPFKHISEEGINKEVIDEEDERLQELKNELGEDPYNAVVTALKELNEYSPHDRTPQIALWNFKTEEQSNLREGVQFLLNKWRQAKNKR